MPNLTKRQTLTDCIKLWQHLAENPNKKKVSFYQAVKSIFEHGPILTYHNAMKADAVNSVLSGKAYLNNCPCCEYAKQSGNCEDSCIINWTGNKGTVFSTQDCLQADSPYFIWRTTHKAAVRRQAALRIVELAWLALEDIQWES